MKGYSTIPACDPYEQDWRCYFKDLSPCQAQLIRDGKKVPTPVHDHKTSLVPAQFEHLGLAWWWGILQRRMFRLRENVLEVMNVLVTSVCRLIIPCPLFFLSFFLSMIATKAVLHEGAKFREGLGFPLTPPVGGVHVRHGDKRIDGFAYRTLKSELLALKASPENLASINKTRGYAVTHEHFMDISFDLYVASDDKNVIAEARNGGFMTSPIGVSQDASDAGVFSTLSNEKGSNLGYNATIEIVTDIFYLSHCSTLVGTASSQVYRMAVDMANASGILEYAVAIDHSSLPKIRGMSAKWGLPVPEVPQMSSN